MMTFPRYGNIKIMFQTTNQIYGGLQKWKYPKLAGWFISWKIASING
jgi:hypothetical protein